MKVRNKILMGVVTCVIVLLLTSCTETNKRAWKTTYSSWTGGLDRTVTVYSYDGMPIKSWSGRFDISESDQEMYFDIDGKRVVIQGGIIISEEN